LIVIGPSTWNSAAVRYHDVKTEYPRNVERKEDILVAKIKAMGHIKRLEDELSTLNQKHQEYGV